MNVLVTGGAGFIGSYIVDELVRRGHRVRVFDNLDPQVHPNRCKPDYLNSDAEFVEGDVRDLHALKMALEGQEVVFHEAAAVGMGQSQYQIKHYVDVNIGGTANLLELIVNTKNSVRKIIVAASQSSYGEGLCECARHGQIKPDFRGEEQLQQHRWEHECPHCGSVMKPVATPETASLQCRAIYAMTKRDQEEMVQNVGQTYGIPAVALRYFNVYGPRQSLSNPYTGVLAIFMSRLANGHPPVIYEDGWQTRDFVSVHDIVQANLLAMEKEAADYQVFNVGEGKPTSIREATMHLAGIYQTAIEPEITGSYRKGDTRHSFADLTHISSRLGYQPQITMEEGMRELVEWSRTTRAEDHFEQASLELRERGLA